MTFEWDYDKALRNRQRHGVAFKEAMEAFLDRNALDDFDEAHPIEEARYNLIGMSSRRLLFIVYTERKDNVIRIISARKAEQKHQKAYEQ